MTPPLASFLATSRSSSARRRDSVGDAAQRPRPQHLVVGRRHLVGDGLIGALRLELGDVRGEACLVVTTQPPTEVADKPLKLQFRKLIAGIDVDTERYRTEAGYEVEGIGEPGDLQGSPARVQVETTYRIPGCQCRQEGREGNVLSSLGLANALQGRLQSGLTTEGQCDRVG